MAGPRTPPNLQHLQFRSDMKTVNDKYDINCLTEGQFEEIMEGNLKPLEMNRAIVAGCLNNADSGTRTAEDMKAIPLPDWRELLQACLDINKLETTKNAVAAQVS
jgi:hypothetical protein